VSDTNNGEVASNSGSKGAAGTYEKPVESGVSVQRRKLIKASAAAIPVIMTLRSGAAAAMTSSANRCLTNPDTLIKTESDIGGIDYVLGDEYPPPPLDEWLRVVAKPGMKLMMPSGQSSKYKPYYLIKDNTSSSWDDIEGWLIYDKDGELKVDNPREKLLGHSYFTTAWNTRVAFYGVDSYPHGWVFIDKSGGAVTPPVPGGVSSAMKISTTQVYLLAYYNAGPPVVVTYYPMPREGDALLINGSCLTSINPAFQI